MPARPSPGFLCYLDSIFIGWTRKLVHKGLVNGNHWPLSCPRYLFGCCPRITALEYDSVTISQLTDMTPAHAFAYVLTRRLAEAVVQFCTCWLLVGCLIILLITTWKSVTRRQNTDIPNVGHFNLKNVCLLLLLVPMSILLPLLADRAIGSVIDYQLQIVKEKDTDSWLSLTPWKTKDLLNHREPPSLLHLFDFFHLYRSLYSDINQSLLPKSTTPFCQQTALSIYSWSVLVFVIIVYAIVTLVIRTIVWKPLKFLLSCLTTEESNENRTLKGIRSSLSVSDKIDGILEMCSKKILVDGEKRSSEAADFTTNIEKEKLFSPSDEHANHLDSCSNCDHETLFSVESNSISTVKAVSDKNKDNKTSLPGNSTNLKRTLNLAIRPRYISRAVQACSESD